MVTGIGQAPWESVAMITSKMSRTASHYARIKYALQFEHMKRLEDAICEKVVKRRFTKQTLKLLGRKNIVPNDIRGMVRLGIMESFLEKEMTKEVQVTVVNVTWSRWRELRPMYKRDILPLFSELETEIWTA
jgi:hypothetical protein